MRRSAQLIVPGLVIIFAVSAAAQMSSTASPELKKLDYFSGTWTSAATIPAGPWGAGGKFTATGTNEWMKGAFFLVSHADFSLPPELGGSGSAISVYAYDPDKRVDTEDRFDSIGRHEKRTGTLNGDTWTWNSEFDYAGMTIQSRLTVKTISATSYSTKLEVSSDNGASWTSFWDGTAAKK
jgi:hypothetical protein